MKTSLFSRASGKPLSVRLLYLAYEEMISLSHKAHWSGVVACEIFPLVAVSFFISRRKQGAHDEAKNEWRCLKIQMDIRKVVKCAQRSCAHCSFLYSPLMAKSWTPEGLLDWL